LKITSNSIDCTKVTCIAALSRRGPEIPRRRSNTSDLGYRCLWALLRCVWQYHFQTFEQAVADLLRDLIHWYNAQRPQDARIPEPLAIPGAAACGRR
jgi:hypothetical protein